MNDIISCPKVNLFESRTYWLINVEYYTAPLRGPRNELEDATYASYSTSLNLFRENRKQVSLSRFSEPANSDSASKLYIDSAFTFTN